MSFAQPQLNNEKDSLGNLANPQPSLLADFLTSRLAAEQELPPVPDISPDPIMALRPGDAQDRAQGPVPLPQSHPGAEFPPSFHHPGFGPSQLAWIFYKLGRPASPAGHMLRCRLRSRLDAANGYTSGAHLPACRRSRIGSGYDFPHPTLLAPAEAFGSPSLGPPCL